MAAIERFHFPRTGYRGTLRSHPSANFVLVSFAPNCVQVLNTRDLSNSVAVLLLTSRILQFEIEEYDVGKFAVWLLTSDQIHATLLDASGNSIVAETSGDLEEKSKNIKKRPHGEEEAHSTPKKSRTSLPTSASQKAHSLAQARRVLVPTLIKALSGLSTIATTPIGLLVQGRASKDSFLLSHAGEESPFASREGFKDGEHVTSVTGLSDSKLYNCSIVPAALLFALIGSLSSTTDSPVLLAATDLGKVVIVAKRDSRSPYQIVRSLPTRLDRSPILLLDYVTLSDTVGALIAVNRNGQVSVLKESDSSFVIKRFSLMRTIDSICRVGPRFAITSDGSTLNFSIQATLDIMISTPQTILSSPPSRILTCVSSSDEYLVLDTASSLAKCSIQATKSEIEPGNIGHKISTALKLLTQNLDYQDHLKSEEQQVDTLIQNINLAIQAGTGKSHFTLRISPKIESDLSTLILSLMVPSFLNSLKFWSLSLSIKQGDDTHSYSIPLEDFQAPKASKTKSQIPALQYRLGVPYHSLHPMGITAYINFHIASHLPRKKSQAGDEPMVLVPADGSEYATFLLGDFKFDALQLMVRSKAESESKPKAANLSFQARMRQILTMGNRSALTSANSSPLTMDLNLSSWTLPSWNELSEDKISALLGSLFKSLPTTSSKISDPSNSDSLTFVVESSINGALATILIRSFSEAGKSADARPALGKSKKPISKLSSKELACVVSIMAKGRGEEVRSAIVRRIAGISYSSTNAAKEDVSMARELTESLQDPWRQVMRLETAFFEIEQKLVRFLEYKQWRQSHKGHPRVLKTASYLHEYEGAQSQEKRPPDVPNFDAVNKEATALLTNVTALYHQVRNIIGEKYAF